MFLVAVGRQLRSHLSQDSLFNPLVFICIDRAGFVHSPPIRLLTTCVCTTLPRYRDWGRGCDLLGLRRLDEGVQDQNEVASPHHGFHIVIFLPHGKQLLRRASIRGDNSLHAGRNVTNNHTDENWSTLKAKGQASRYFAEFPRPVFSPIFPATPLLFGRRLLRFHVFLRFFFVYMFRHRTRTDRSFSTSRRFFTQSTSFAV